MVNSFLPGIGETQEVFVSDGVGREANVQEKGLW